jgi:hypothetical protein
MPGLWVRAGKSLSVAGCGCRVVGGLFMNVLNHIGSFLVQVTNSRFMTWAEAKTALSEAWAKK